MSAVGYMLSALALAFAAYNSYLHVGSDIGPVEADDGPFDAVLGFYGIGQLPLFLAAGAVSAGAGAAGLAITAVAGAAVAPLPAWAWLVALVTALHGGILAAWAVAGVRTPDP